jgi:quinol-cytochrome oxidoreductase complex cytochrome b subunit
MKTSSFFLHIRPNAYQHHSLIFSTTFYLGFISVLLLVVECITGVFLMVYYVPTPEDAYGSIVRLSTEVPFGHLFRDLHRLAGELMIIVLFLHTIKVFLKGSFRGSYRLTWITGVLLFLCTLFLAFSGYLLPWDQLAYWAVTIGTSMVDTIPIIGGAVTMILRGGAEFGQDGLLRFYLLHVIGLPIVVFLLLGVHYYRVSKYHSKSKVQQYGQRHSFLPDVALREYFLTVVILLMLIITAAFLYESPLEYHADPLYTPADTQAPWFFLWLQGALKLGDSFLMGVLFPMAILGLLLLVPFMNFEKMARRLPAYSSHVGVGVALVILIGLTYAGFPRYGVNHGPVAQLFQDYLPEGKPSRFHHIGYDQMEVGAYPLGPDSEQQSAGMLGNFLDELEGRLADLESLAGFNEVTGIVLVEELQADLRRIIVRVTWYSDQQGEVVESAEKLVFLHKYSG